MDTLQKVEDRHTKLAEELKAQGVKYVTASWIDIKGRPRGKSNPIDMLPDLLAGSTRYTPRGITGIGEMNPVEEEVTSWPDESTLTILPWDRRYAWMAADMWSDKGEYFELCPSSILKNQMEKALELGYKTTLGIEPEFYLFKKESLEEDANR